MSSPPEKKRKSNDGSSSWRDKSIARFDLKPVPSKWKDAVGTYSEDSWERYYRYRVGKEDDNPLNKKSYSDHYDSDGNSIPSDDDDECKWEKEAMESILYGWIESDFSGMEKITKSMVEGCKWQWTPKEPRIEWEEENQPRSVDYYAHVWSPYAIPHAIQLNHSWYGKMRYSGFELQTDWNYRLLDFEEDIENQSGNYYKELCSANSDDEIKTSHLNKATVGKLRKFLYGTNSKESKKLTCSDTDFLLLLFGSMGSTDKNLEEDEKDCSLGYTWCPWKDEAMKKKLFDAKAPEDDDPNGDPPTSLEKYNPRWCSWLRYRILEVTDSLGPISKHYQPPSQKKSSYDNEYGSDDDDSYGRGLDYGDY